MTTTIRRGSSNTRRIVEQETISWAGKIGTSLHRLGKYSAFAVQGSARSTGKYYGRSEGSRITDAKRSLHLNVHNLAGRKTNPVVLSLPLNKPLAVAALTPYCRPAPYGDLDTQTTVLNPSVRSALEIPSVEHAKPLPATVAVTGDGSSSAGAVGAAAAPAFGFSLTWEIKGTKVTREK